MKKVFLTLVAVMAVSVSMVAAPKAEKNAEPTQYTIDFNSRSIARYLSMSYDQVAEMELVHDNFSREGCHERHLLHAHYLERKPAP